MTTPSVVSSKYAGTDADFLKCKVDRSGALRTERFTASVASGTASDAVIGLVPFQKGFRFNYASTIRVSDMDSDSDLTLDFGYVYDDNTTYTNDGNAFASQVTTGQAGGFITFNAAEGLEWVAEANGWIVMVVGVGGTASASAAEVEGQIVGSYDS